MATTLPLPPGPYQDRALVTVHGINSDNTGLGNVSRYCKQRLPGLLVENIYFGRVLPFKELTPVIQDLVVSHIRDRLDLFERDFLRAAKRKLFILAHSFGTIATVRALEQHLPHVCVTGLLLVGSVVRRNYSWDTLITRGTLADPPVAVVRPFDRIVQGAAIVRGGPSGAKGFIPQGVFQARETFKDGGHIAYDPDDGDDVATMIDNGIGAVPEVTRDQWYSRLGRLARLRLLLRFP